MDNLRISVTQCYVVEIVDEHDMVSYYKTNVGKDIPARDYCFGTEEEAKEIGNRLMEYVKRSN